jgi:glycosyltransferase involved in cell wall biosynthesis
VWWQHGIPARSPVEWAAARLPAAAIVCVSASSAAAQRRLTPKRNVVTIHPGAAIEDIQAARGSGAEIRRRRSWNGSPVVGIVGRLEPWKRQDVFLRAAALVAAAHPDTRFAVVGGAILGWEDSYPDDLVRLAGQLGIAEHVHFAGHQEEPWAWMDALDVVVHASRDEPFGLVLVEAMALGKPLVATRGAGASDIVEDGVSGVLVDPDRPQELADAIGGLLDDPALRDRLAIGGPPRAATFGDEQMAKRWTNLLQGVAR